MIWAVGYPPGGTRSRDNKILHPAGRLAHAEDFVRTWAPAQRHSGDGIVLALGYGSDLAGVIDLKRTDWRHRETEIGYWAAPGFRGLGLITEAVAALARWVLAEQGFERAELRAATGNTASVRVAVKAGFGYEGAGRPPPVELPRLLTRRSTMHARSSLPGQRLCKKGPPSSCSLFTLNAPLGCAVCSAASRR